MELGLRHLRYFVAVAEEGGFTRAASRLHLTQPPLSVAIRQLERGLGLQLLDRTGNRVELTSAGRDFLAHAKSLLRHWQVAVDSARQAGGQEIERLVVAFRPAVCHPLAHRTIERIREEHSEYQVVPRHVQWTDQTACLRGGDADVSFVLDPADYAGLDSATVAMLPRVVCLRSTHRLAGRDSVLIDDLNEVPIIRPAGGSPESSDFWGGVRPGNPVWKEHPTATRIDEAIDLVALENAAVLVPATVMTVQHRQDIVFIPVADVPAARLSLAWREGSDSELVRLAVRCAQAVAQDPAVQNALRRT
ncbi:LysR family transcriptional regulator [Sphaerisporangium siamense]|uniref:DNA-binding transcriptional LysR family regulator n=1 Tax=Sphaerisporangium siamense TaxID=795645 RepID=A0A7W7G999_9ACTN|nr:LysR family transcriptional regulator [Sphaerisporangium siamense]MBB4700375.1 DNA-binding transcriptional LysR family regulator [Sphaerisporangium siamense]GII87793.1 LysR family transcriptional regulator [Sphaerisporangium siamense]